MANIQEIADFGELKKVIDSADKSLNSLTASFDGAVQSCLKLVKASSEGSQAIKDKGISVDNLNKAQKETIEIDKQKEALNKQFIKTNEQLRQAESGELKELLQKKIALQAATKALNDEVRAEGLAETSLVRMRQRLSELTKAYDSAETRTKGAAKEINTLSKEIGKAEEATNRHGRNVGNYSESITSAFGQIGAAAGGTFGKVTEGVEQVSGGLMSLVKGGGVMALVTAAIGLIAKVWKDAKENMDLYLKSADKTKYAGAGYEKDAEAARIDTRKRAQGQINLGYQMEQEYRKKLDYAFGRYTEEERKSFEVKIASGKQMQIDGKLLLDEVRGVEDKAGWEMKYNDLITEADKIKKEGAKREQGEWKVKDNKLREQRLIVTDDISTDAQKKQAGIDADKIAAELAGDKTKHYEKQFGLLIEIAKMKNEDEKVEELGIELDGKRLDIQSEFIGDQIMANKISNLAAKDEKSRVKDAAEAAKKKAEEAEKQQKLKQGAILSEIKDDEKRAQQSLAFDRDDLLRATKNKDQQYLIWQKFYADLTKLIADQTKKRTDIEWDEGVKTAHLLFDQSQKTAKEIWDSMLATDKIKDDTDKSRLENQLKNNKITKKNYLVEAEADELLAAERDIKNTEELEAKKAEIRERYAQLEIDRNKSIREQIYDAVIQGLQSGADAVFNIKKDNLQTSLEAELEKENQHTAKLLENKNLTEKQKTIIEEQGAARNEAIQKKYAKEQQKMSITQAIINGVLAVAKTFAQYGFTPPGWIAAGLMAVQTGIQVAVIKAQKFAKGTENAPERGIFGEAGRELMFTRSGDVALAEKPTYFEGSKFKGAQIFSNPETERMLKYSDVSSRTDDRLLNEMILTRKAILSKPVAIFDKENRMIGQGNSQYQKIYINRLLHNN